MQHKYIAVAIAFLLLLLLACQLAPDAEPTDVPTEALTDAPTEAPTTEAPTTEAPTALPTEPPTDAPTDAPTQAPTEVPTAIPSPTPPTAPVILSFTAEPMAITERDTVTLRWRGEGATEAAIWWYDRRALPAPPVEYVGTPNEGVATINPDNSPIHLTLRNAHGETNAEITLVINCAHAWAPEMAANPPGRCPEELHTTWAAQQPFENGVMIWFEHTQRIYVFYNTGRWYSYADNFREGDPESDPGITPPAGLYQPVRGFGLIWRSYPEVRNGLGWATAQESGFDSWMQNYTWTGMHNVSTYLRDINQRIYHLDNFGSSWRIHNP